MKEDILYRLRTYYPQHPTCMDAANEIDMLRTQVGRLENALQWLVERCDNDSVLCNDEDTLHAEAVLAQLYEDRG